MKQPVSASKYFTEKPTEHDSVEEKMELAHSRVQNSPRHNMTSTTPIH